MKIEVAVALLGSLKVGDRVEVVRDGNRRRGEVTRALRGPSKYPIHQLVGIAGDGWATNITVGGVAGGYVEVVKMRPQWSLQGAPIRE